MAKYNNILKYLGKEDSYSPEQVLKGINSAEVQENLDNLTNLPQENIDNMENLIRGNISGQVPAAEGSGTASIIEIDPDVIKEIESLDTQPPNIAELQARLQVQNYEAMPEAAGPVESAETAETAPVMETPEGGEDLSPIMEPQFREMPSFEEPTLQEEKPETPIEIQKTEESVLPDISEMLRDITPSEKAPAAADEEMPSLSEFFEPSETKEAPIPEFEMPEIKPSEEIKIPETPAAPPPFELPEIKTETAPSERPIEMQIPEEKAGAMPVIENIPVSEKKPSEEPKGKSELDHDKALKVREKINKLSDHILRRKIRQIILESKIPADVIQQIITLLLNNENEAKIRAIVDMHMPDEIIREKAPKKERAPGAGRRVIYTEETKRVKEFRREFTGATRYMLAFIIFIVALVISIWQLVWIPYTAGIHFKKGITYFKIHNYNAVELEFEAGKRIDDSRIGGPDLNWNSVYASRYIEQKLYDDARKKFEDALAYNPYHKETIYNYADFYKNYYYPPRFDTAIKLYGVLTNKWPDNFEYLDKIGTTEIEWGDRSTDPNEKAAHYVDANSLYENYVQKPSHKKHVDSYYRLMDIALRVTNKDRIDILYDTIDHYNKTAVNTHSLTGLARYYIDNRRLDRAKLVFEKMIPTKPQYDEAYYEYARFLTINLDFYRAIQAISNSIILNSRNGKAYNLLGEIYYVTASISNTNVIINAIKQFENSIQFSPNYYKPFANLGHIYFYNKLNFDRPEEALKKAFDYYKTALILLEKDKTDELLSYNIGWLYYKYGEYTNAYNEFGKIYVDDPHNPVLSYNIGNIYFYWKNYSFALIEFDKAIEYYQTIADKIGYINPELDRHKEIYTQLARCYNNRGVTYAIMAKKYKNEATQFDQNALLDFYRAKDNANKINSIYNFAEYNIKFMINRSIKKKVPALDNELVKRTTLQRFIEEFKQKMITNI